MAKAKTEEDVRKEVSSLYGGEYSLIEYGGLTKLPMTIEHKCGHKYSIRCKSFTNEGKGQCPKCTTKRKPQDGSPESFLKELKNFRGDDVEYIQGYTGKLSDSTVMVKCLSCFKPFTTSGRELIRKDGRHTSCPICANIRRRDSLVSKNAELFIGLEEMTKNTEYKFLEAYNGDNKEKLLIKHIECGRDYRVRPNDFQQGYRCPHCAIEASESKGVKEITRILEERDLVFCKEQRFEDCRNILPLPFDFSISLENGELLLIEYDGEQHFKPSFGRDSEEKQSKMEKIQLRDSIKNNYVNEKSNLHLERVRYDVDDLSESMEEIFTRYKI